MWPGQTEAQAQSAASILEHAGITQREFYYPFQTRIEGTTVAQLQLLAEMAGHGDWLARCMLTKRLNFLLSTDDGLIFFFLKLID